MTLDDLIAANYHPDFNEMEHEVMTEKVIDTQKSQELVDHLNNMTNEEVHYTFTQMGYEGLLNLNLLMAHALKDILEHAKEQVKKDNH